MTPIFEQNSTFEKNTFLKPDPHTTGKTSTKKKGHNSASSIMTKQLCISGERKEWDAAGGLTFKHIPGHSWAHGNQQQRKCTYRQKFWHFKSQKEPPWGTDKYFGRAQQNCQLERGGEGAPGLSGSRLEWSWSRLGQPNGCQQPPNSAGRLSFLGHCVRRTSQKIHTWQKWKFSCILKNSNKHYFEIFYRLLTILRTFRSP